MCDWVEEINIIGLIIFLRNTPVANDIRRNLVF